MATCSKTRNSSCEFHRDRHHENGVEGDQDHEVAALVLDLDHDLVADHDPEANQEVDPDPEDDHGHDPNRAIVPDHDEDLEDEVGVDFYLLQKSKLWFFEPI